MTEKKKPACDCFFCSLSPWAQKLVLLLPFGAVAIGVVGIGTNVEFDDPLTQGAEAPAVPTPTVNGMFVTFTPTPTVAVAAVSPAERVTGSVGVSAPPATAPPPVGVPQLAFVTNTATPPANTPTATAAIPTLGAPTIPPTATPCVLPRGLCKERR